jgi:hypothetical protein
MALAAERTPPAITADPPEVAKMGVGKKLDRTDHEDAANLGAGTGPVFP